MSEEVTIEIGAEAVADADIDDAVAVAVADAVADEVVTTDLLATEALNAVALAAEAAAAESAAESAAAEVAAAEVAADDDSSVAEKVTVYFENVEENIEKAIKLVRDEGMYVAKAAGQTGVPIKKLEAIVKDMKERGELTMNWDSRRVETTPRVDKEGKVIQRKKRRFVDWNYTTEDVHAAANAVKNGEYSVKGAYKAFKIPVRDIKRAMKGEEVKGRICTPKFIRLRKRGKLTEEEEKVVMEYAFALNKLKHPITYKTMAPLAKQLLKLRDETLADEKGWWIAFVKRHQELEGLYQTPLQLTALANHRHHWAKQYFSRLVEVFENGEFFSKPSRIYACEIEQFEVERWESDCAKLVEVEMLVAANAVGYHVLPPCVVYASEGEDIPDFLGLPEAGFVAAEEKKVSAAILAEWFRSVFLHYLPSRSADDPVMLILKGTNEWLTPELITMAEQQFVHLVPMHSKVLKYLSPIQPLLHSLKEAYKEKLSQYKQTELRRQAESPAKEAFFPVTFRKLFSNCFSMYEIQEVFRTRGVFPLKPDEADLGIKDDPPKQEGKKKKKWIPIKEQYPRSYAEMVKNDIIFVPPPRLVPANIPQMPMTYSTTAGGLFYNHLGVPVQLNQLVGQNQVVAGTNIVRTNWDDSECERNRCAESAVE
ncbi:uncharacterized protein [Amphiura filiformis]|uniref:uncharacterized protein n=1 Tax=Amphiura filiformis TaxID=82378 RepID=UPI003B21FB3A